MKKLQYIRTKRKIIMLWIIIIISFNWCFAQDNKKLDNKLGWINIGVGGGSFGSSTYE